jgi:UDP-N-acetylmuramate--alanine ligase
MNHVHFVGISGSGLSAIARLLVESGYQVSGSDRLITVFGRDLMAAGVHVVEGHAAANIAGADVVVRSSAVPDDNPEVVAARAAGIPVLKRADFLGELMQNKFGIAVAGTHGKTTTTAMIAWMLTRLNQNPSYIIGGISKNLGNNAHAGLGEAFVIEADEYDRMFLGLSPRLTVVTYLEHDHPDCYPTIAEYRAAFIAFVGRLQPGGTLLVCADHAATTELAKSAPRGSKAITYGMAFSADYSARSVQRNNLGGLSCEVWFGGKKLANLALQAPGEHNLRNALAALAVAHQMKLNPAQAALALGEFSGTGRRFDIQGEAMGITVIDDYAHHPTEIAATLAAARLRYPERRIVAVWQPHTYSRTQTLFDQFAQCFKDADWVIVTEVYAAREAENSFSAAQVVAAMSHPRAQFIPNLVAVSQELLAKLQSGDVLLVLSAGDADQVSAQVLAALKKREVTHD